MSSLYLVMSVKFKDLEIKKKTNESQHVEPKHKNL